MPIHLPPPLLPDAPPTSHRLASRITADLCEFSQATWFSFKCSTNFHVRTSTPQVTFTMSVILSAIFLSKTHTRSFVHEHNRHTFWNMANLIAVKNNNHFQMRTYTHRTNLSQCAVNCSGYRYRLRSRRLRLNVMTSF